jgi:hypothetical protein
VSSDRYALRSNTLMMAHTAGVMSSGVGLYSAQVDVNTRGPLAKSGKFGESSRRGVHAAAP